MVWSQPYLRLSKHVEGSLNNSNKQNKIINKYLILGQVNFLYKISCRGPSKILGGCRGSQKPRKTLKGKNEAKFLESPEDWREPTGATSSLFTEALRNGIDWVMIKKFRNTY